MRYRRIGARLISAVVLALAFAAAAAAQDMAAKADEYLNAHVKQSRFSGSVLIAKGGKIILSKGYGMANYEHDAPNAPQTKFRLASITKQFTATAIMQLQEKGLLSVDDPLTKYFPDYKTAQGVTIHHLLSHTSGIFNYTNDPQFRQNMRVTLTPEKLFDTFKEKPLDFQPGDRFNYSNSGYALLGMIIEKVSGKSYEDYLKENIFGPLGMSNSGYDHSEVVLKNRALGYNPGPNGRVHAQFLDMSQPYSAGALYSTVEDLYLWDRALYTEKLLKKSSLARMFTPVKNGYGYGWAMDEQNGHKRIGHAGGINGFSTQIFRYVDDDAVVIVLGNTVPAPIGSIASDLGKILLGLPVEVPRERVAIKLDPKLLDAYVGHYEIPQAFTMVVIRQGDRLLASPEGQPPTEIFPESETKFFIKVVDAQISFVKNEKGEVTQLILHQNGRDMAGKKIK
jgi:CubicO group peptidase (beta-lactamase class C family)